LRNLIVLNGSFDDFNPNNVPETPHELFFEWLQVAIQQEVSEPHAMTLSTVDAQGQPDARILILKNIDQNGWCFATSSESQKGKQLAQESKVALTFYWPKLGRQIRIRGEAVRMEKDISTADFLERNETARAGALIGKQSSPLLNNEELDSAYPAWGLYCVSAYEVEFWQGKGDRKHTRLQYRLVKKQWIRELLWP
jgi:pyridoxamine 5'-phosphate oxidase